MKAILEVRIKKLNENEYEVSGHSKQNCGFMFDCPKDHIDANLEEYARDCGKKYSALEIRIIQDDRQTKIEAKQNV